MCGNYFQKQVSERSFLRFNSETSSGARVSGAEDQWDVMLMFRESQMFDQWDVMLDLMRMGVDAKSPVNHCTLLNAVGGGRTDVVKALLDAHVHRQE